MSIKYEQRTVDLAAGISQQLSDLPHLHKEIEMIYVLNGNTAAFADNKRYDLSKGDLFIAFPNQIHYYYNEHPGEFALIITKSDLLIGLKSLLNNIHFCIFRPSGRCPLRAPLLRVVAAFMNNIICSFNV